MLRRTLRIVLRIAAVVALLVVLGVAVLTVTGMPVPATITADGVPKVSMWRVPAVLRAMSGAPMPMRLLGVDDAGRLLISRGFGVFAVSDDGTLAPATQAYAEQYGDLDVQALPGRSGTFLVRRMRNAAEESDLLLVEGDREDTLLVGTPEVGAMAASPDGRLVVAFARGTNGGTGTLVRIGLDSLPYRAHPVATLQGSVRVEAVAADHQTAWILASPAETDAKLLAVNLETGDMSPVLADEAGRSVFHASPFDFPGARFGLLDDSTALYVRTGPDSSTLETEFTRLWLVDLPSGRTRRISSNEVPGDVVDFAVSADRRTVLFVQEERAMAGLMAWQREGDALRVVHRDRAEPLAPYGGYSLLLDPSGSRVFFQTFAADGPRIRTADMSGGPSRVLVSPATDGEPRYAFREFEYPTSQPTIGVMNGIHSFLYRPLGRDDERLPVIVVFHGGPTAHDVPHLLDPFITLYLQRGFTVITPNYRGSLGYGTTFEQADDGVRRHEQVEDVLALADWIRTQPDLDADRVVLSGASWGGFMTLAGLIADSTRFRGGFVWAPATLRPDTIAQGGRLAPWNRAEFGDMRDSVVRQAIARVSPALNAGRIRQPLYVFQGAGDARVMVETVRQMRDSIRANVGSLWYVESATAGHGPPSSPFEGAYFAAALVEFLDLMAGR